MFNMSSFTTLLQVRTRCSKSTLSVFASVLTASSTNVGINPVCFFNLFASPSNTSNTYNTAAHWSLGSSNQDLYDVPPAPIHLSSDWPRICQKFPHPHWLGHATSVGQAVCKTCRVTNLIVNGTLQNSNFKSLCYTLFTSGMELHTFFTIQLFPHLTGPTTTKNTFWSPFLASVDITVSVKVCTTPVCSQRCTSL